jgi:hypothetical protein
MNRYQFDLPIQMESVKSIAGTLSISLYKARQIKKLITGKIDPITVLEDVRKNDPIKLEILNVPAAHFYKHYKRAELKLMAIDIIMNGYGIEAITMENAYVDKYWFNCVAIYVNVGETYQETIIYDTDANEFELASWGDWYEKHEPIYNVI